MEPGVYRNLWYNKYTDKTILTIDDNEHNFSDDDIDIKYYNFIKPLLTSEIAYFTMIDIRNLKPQEAREVLPNALKTEVVMTGFVSDWKHFFDLRCAKSAHPDMKKLADELYDKFSKE